MPRSVSKRKALALLDAVLQRDATPGASLDLNVNLTVAHATPANGCIAYLGGRKKLCRNLGPEDCASWGLQLQLENPNVYTMPTIKRCEQM